MNSDFWEKIQKSGKFEEFEKEFINIVDNELYIYGLGLNPNDTATTLETTDQAQRTQTVIEINEEVHDATITKWMADSNCDELCLCGHCTHCRHICSGSYH